MAMNGNGNTRWVQLVFSGLLLIAMAVSGYAITKTDNLASAVEEKTVKKEQYYRDQNRLEEALKCIQATVNEIRSDQIRRARDGK